MTAALIAEGLHTFYGKSHILHDVSLEAAEGQVTALLGRNGAGKTTTLRSVMGLTPPRDGRITMFGTETTGWPSFRVAALGVGYVPEGRRIFPNLTVDENLLVPLERPGPWTPATVYQLFPRLQERRASRGRQLSGRRAGDAVDRARAAAQSQTPDSRRTFARTGAPHRARSFSHRGADAFAGHYGSPGRAKCAHEVSKSPTMLTCSTMATSSIRDLPMSWQPMRRGSSRLPAQAPRNGNSRAKAANTCQLEFSLSSWDRARTWRTFR